MSSSLIFHLRNNLVNLAEKHLSPACQNQTKRKDSRHKLVHMDQTDLLDAFFREGGSPYVDWTPYSEKTFTFLNANACLKGWWRYKTAITSSAWKARKKPKPVRRRSTGTRHNCPGLVYIHTTCHRLATVFYELALQREPWKKVVRLRAPRNSERRTHCGVWRSSARCLLCCMASAVMIEYKQCTEERSGAVCACTKGLSDERIVTQQICTLFGKKIPLKKIV